MLLILYTYTHIIAARVAPLDFNFLKISTYLEYSDNDIVKIYFMTLLKCFHVFIMEKQGIVIRNVSICESVVLLLFLQDSDQRLKSSQRATHGALPLTTILMKLST